MESARRWRTAALLVPLLVGAVLRAYPMHRPYLGIELQEMYPLNAITAITRGNWEPFALHHGGGLLTVMRASFTVWYGVGRLAGIYADRLDLLASFLRDPFPYVVAGRLLLLACSLLTIVLVFRIGTRLGTVAAGGAGALLLAVTFIHVRETHHVWLDVPAGAAALATVGLALRAARGGGTRALVVTALAAGVSLASKHSTFALAMPVLLATWWNAGGRPAAAARRAAVVGVVTLSAYAVMSPYAVVKFQETVRVLTALHGILFGQEGQSLSLLTCLYQGIGLGILALGAVGLAAAARADPRSAAIAVAFPVGYGFVLARESLLYARYLAVLAPFVAMFAGLGAQAVGRLLTPARPALGAVAIALVAAAAPAAQSAGFDLLLARRDTRQLAADWILANVPAGTPITVQNAVGYPNPVLPMNAFQVRFRYPKVAAELTARGIGDPAKTHPQQYLGFFGRRNEGWHPTHRWVVTSTHPVALADMNALPEQLERLHAAGAREVARFEGFREPIPPRVVYEPVEADYVPLSGFGALERPGPNITVWELPVADGSPPAKP